MFVAAQIASALQRSKRRVLLALERIPATGVKIVHGNPARAWCVDALPQELRAALEQASARHAVSVESLLTSPPLRWRPKYPLSQLTEKAIARASLLSRALAPSIARLDDPTLTRAEFEHLGVEDYRRIVGHSISTNYWRRIMNRTLKRDQGAKNWGRLEIYVDECPMRRPAFPGTRRLTERIAFEPLRELIASFANPASPTDLEKDCLWIHAFELHEREAERRAEAKAVKQETLKFLCDYAPFLGRSPKGIKLQFNRKLNRWLDGGRIPAAIADPRRRNSGRRMPEISPDDENALIAKTLRSGGRVAQAWRELRESGKLSAEISQHYIATPASKSYVPPRVRKLIGNKIKMLRDHHHGPRSAKLNGAYVNRDPTTFNAGDWFQADDTTLPNYYFVENEQGIQLIRGQFLAMCDCRTTFILGFVLIPQRNYTAHHIRNLTTVVADRYGLPRKGFYYENGMWRTARLLHGRRDEIQWHQTEMGLRGLGLQFRHAQLPRGKVIERVFGLLQNHLENEPGYAGRDERHEKFERVQEQISLVRRGKAPPDDFFLSETEYLRQLEAIVRIYNEERQEGKYCPGLSPREAFEKFHGNEPRVLLEPSCRHLLASHKMRVRCGRNGISFRFGSEQFTYKSYETGRLRGEELIVWFNVENPSLISISNLKEDPDTIFTVEREIKVPGMDAPPEILEAALAQNEAHEAYRKGLYRAVSQNFSTGFAGRMFRKNLIDRKTTDIGDAIRKQQTQVRRRRTEATRRAAAIERKASQLGIPREVVKNHPDTQEGIEEMTTAMRNLGFLSQSRKDDR